MSSSKLPPSPSDIHNVVNYEQVEDSNKSPSLVGGDKLDLAIQVITYWVNLGQPILIRTSWVG